MEVKNMANIWFNAFLEKYRFTTAKGVLSTEDLFDLKMKDLDKLYQDLSMSIDELKGNSLFDNEENVEKMNAIKALTDKKNIVEAIFNYHKAQQEAAQKLAKTKAMKDELNEVIAQKQKDELASMDIEQLKEIRDSL